MRLSRWYGALVRMLTAATLCEPAILRCCEQVYALLLPLLSWISNVVKKTSLNLNVSLSAVYGLAATSPPTHSLLIQPHPM